MSRLSSLILLFAAGSCSPAFGAEGRYFRSNGAGEIVEVRNLGQSDCQPSRFRGRVVKRVFDRDETILSALIIEGGRGEREYINVAVPVKLDMATLGSIVRGLQTLTRVGSIVEGEVGLCGAAGRVQVLSRIRQSASR